MDLCRLSMGYQRLQIENHAAGKPFHEACEAETLVERRSGLVDRVGHEKAECNRAAARELESQPESLLQQVSAEPLPLHAFIDGKTREKNRGDRKPGKPVEGFHRTHGAPLDTRRRQSEISREVFRSG